MEEFRLATPQDYPFLFEMINESYLPDDAFFLEGPRLEHLSDIESLAAMGPFFVVLGEETVGSGVQAIIGCVHFVPTDNRKVKMGLLTIRQSCKKRGLAGKIAAMSHKWAQEAGHTAVCINVVSVKPWLVGLYEKLGYRVTGETPWVGEHVTLTKPCHFILMEKPLGNGEPHRAFGKSMLTHFHMAEGYVNLNHGSFGTTPKTVLAAQHQWTIQMEAKPDIWFREGPTSYRELQAETCKALAQYLNVSDPQDLSLMENSSTGVNSVFRSVQFSRGDKILITNTAYPMVKNLCKYFAERDGVIVVEVPLVFPLTSNDDVIGPVLRALEEHGETIKLASFSHIDSVPGVILPVKDLIALCRSKGIKTVIDGAHAIGQIDVDLSDLDPDYYVTNAHKWLFGPKGSAVFYVKKGLQAEIAPTVINYEWVPGQYVNNFRYTGTRDYTALVSLKPALEFRERVGGDRAIKDYIHQLVWWAGNHLAEKWKTSLIAPEHMVGSMIDIELPVANFAEGEALRLALLKKYDTFFIIYPLQGKVYTRLSAQIYLEKSDFELFGGRFLEELEHIRSQNK